MQGLTVFEKLAQTRNCAPFRGLVVLFALTLFVSASAAPLQVVLVPEEAEKRVLIPRDDVDDLWRTTPNFDDSGWLLCSGAPGGIGFDHAGDYNRFIALNVGGDMGGQTTCYVRAVFNLSTTVRRELDYLALVVRYDDGFVAYLNGERVASANAPTNLHRRAAASQPHEAQREEVFDISQFVGRLRTGNNLLAIHALNVSGDSPDFLILPKLIARKNYKNNFVSDLPILTFKSTDAVGEDVVSAAISIIDKNGAKLTDAAEFSGSAKLQTVRALYTYDKVPYRFILTDAQGRPKDAPLLAMPAGDDWNLSAPFSDKSLMRTAIMSVIAQKMGQAAHSRLVHLFVNDEYRGIYLLIERKTVRPGRIDIAPLTPQDESGDALTGGYLLRIDHQRNRPGFDSPYTPSRDNKYPVHYQFENPGEAITATQQAYIRAWVTRFEKNADTPANPDYINDLNVASFVDYFILNEAAKNVHGYRDMTLFYKDRDSRGGKLAIEPIIDFHHAVGNTAFFEGDQVTGWQIDFLLKNSAARADTLVAPFWWGRLLKDPAFTAPLYKRWLALRQGVLSEENVFHAADSLYRALKTEQVLNFERWMIFDKTVWPNNSISATYDEEFDNMIIWLMDRLDWMDEAMAAFKTAEVRTEQAPIVVSPVLAQNFPNPFNPTTTIRFVTPRAERVQLRVVDLHGKQVVLLLDEHLTAGEHQVTWNAVGQPSGVYFYQLKVGEAEQLKRMVLLR